jgi:hypothetical protein
LRKNSSHFSQKNLGYNKARKAVGIKPTFHLTRQLDSAIPVNFDKYLAEGLLPLQAQ